MSAVFGNNTFLLRKSEFLGTFLVSMTELKLDSSALSLPGSVPRTCRLPALPPWRPGCDSGPNPEASLGLSSGHRPEVFGE